MYSTNCGTGTTSELLLDRYSLGLYPGNSKSSYSMEPESLSDPVLRNDEQPEDVSITILSDGLDGEEESVGHQLSSSFNPLNNREIPLNAACAFRPKANRIGACGAPVVQLATTQNATAPKVPTAPKVSFGKLVSPLVLTNKLGAFGAAQTNSSLEDDYSLFEASDDSVDLERGHPAATTASLTCVGCLDGYEIVSLREADAFSKWNNMRTIKYPVIPCLRENVHFFLTRLEMDPLDVDWITNMTDLSINSNHSNEVGQQYLAVPYLGDVVSWETPIHIHAEVVLNVRAPATGIAMSSWSTEALSEAIEVQVGVGTSQIQSADSLEGGPTCTGSEEWLSLKDLHLLSVICPAYPFGVVLPPTEPKVDAPSNAIDTKNVISVTFMPSLFIPHHLRSTAITGLLKVRFVRPVHARLYADDVFVVQSGPAYLNIVQRSGPLTKKSIKPRQPTPTQNQPPLQKKQQHNNSSRRSTSTKLLAAEPRIPYIPLQRGALHRVSPHISSAELMAWYDRQANQRRQEGGQSVQQHIWQQKEFANANCGSDVGMTELVNNYFGGAGQDDEELTVRADDLSSHGYKVGGGLNKRIQHRLPQSLVPTVSKISQRWFMPKKDELGNLTIQMPLPGKDTEGKLIVIVIDLDRALISREELIRKKFVVVGPDTSDDDHHLSMYEMECTGEQMMKDTWAWVSHYQVVPPAKRQIALGTPGRTEPFLGMLPSDCVSSLTIENVQDPLRATFFLLTPSPQ